MLLGSKIAVIGAGSLRAGAPVFASLANLPLAPETRLVLCDEFPEALDLFDRLARVFAAAKELEISISAVSDIAEAISGASAVILCFGLGKLEKRAEEWLARGALPRETELARAVLLNGAFSAVADALFESVAKPVIVNLVEPVELSGRLLVDEAIHMDWPAPLSASEKVAAAHQALRWIRADEPPFQVLREHKESPLVTALLDAKPPPENRFDPHAVAGWLAELEKLCPGTSPDSLLSS